MENLHREFARNRGSKKKEKKWRRRLRRVQLSPLFQLESSPPPLPGGNHGDRVLSCFMIHSSPAIGRFPKLSAEILWLMAGGERVWGLHERLDRVRPVRSNSSPSNCLFRSMDKGGKEKKERKKDLLCRVLTVIRSPFASHRLARRCRMILWDVVNCNTRVRHAIFEEISRGGTCSFSAVSRANPGYPLRAGYSDIPCN